MLPENDTVTGPCRMTGCPEERVAWTFFCRPHLNDNFAGRIRRLADGTYAGAAGPQTREPQAMSPFVRAALAGRLPAKAVA